MRRFRFVGNPSEYKRWNKRPVFNDIFDEKKHSEYYGSGSEAAWLILDQHEDWQEVFDNDGGTTLTQHKPLHKDTDLGYFAGLFVASFSGNLDSDDKFIHFAKMAGMKHNESGKEAVVRQSISLARELIKQLDEQGHEQ